MHENPILYWSYEYMTASLKYVKTIDLNVGLLLLRTILKIIIKPSINQII